jgi:protein TonB
VKRVLLGLLAAALVHLVILTFGGIFFLGSDDASTAMKVKDVDVLDAQDETKDEEKEAEKRREELEKRKEDEVDTAREKPPEMQKLVDIEQEPASLADATQQLSALSLSALESALAPGGPGDPGEFGATVSLASGGRIGGTGAEGGEESGRNDIAFGLADLDQSARTIFQSPPNYPADLRQRKVEGVVTLVFVVDPEGRVLDPKVERSSDPAFDAPALEAVRRWKFEPAVRNGEKVPSKLRIPIRFSLSS